MTDASRPDLQGRAAQAGVGVDGLQRLWSPWRAAYLDGGADGIDGCPFCVLPSRDPGRDREWLILHRAEHAFVLLNAYPYNPGHLMVVPYAHVGDLAGLDEPVAQQLWRIARHAVGALTQRLHCQGVNLGMNLGHAGGAGIPDHLHLHAVPRWGGDTNFVSTVGATRVLPAALGDVHDLLADAFG